MPQKRLHKQDSYRGLLSKWERSIIKDDNAIPQHRYRVRRRLENGLRVLPLELTEILFSNALYGFNLKNLVLWQNLHDALDYGLQHLLKLVEFEYPVIKSTGSGSFYVSKLARFHYKPGQLVTDVLELKDEDIDTFTDLLGDLEGLKLWLSTRHIKKLGARRIVKKSLQQGYGFPTGRSDAVSMSKIQSWLVENELVNKKQKK